MNACRYHASMSCLPTFAVTILLTLLALPAHALDLGGKWTKSETRNVIVYSNAHDFTTKAIVANIERMRGALGHIMGLRTESAVPTTIFVFDGEAAFAPVRKAVFGGRGPELAGFFTHSDGRFFVAMEIDAGARGDRIVYHEITHSLIENTAADLPLWYQEGVAEFYSTFTVKGKAVVVGSMPKAFVDTMLETGLMPLRRVFAIDTRSPEYNGEHAGAVLCDVMALRALPPGRCAAARRTARNLSAVARCEETDRRRLPGGVRDDARAVPGRAVELREPAKAAGSELHVPRPERDLRSVARAGGERRGRARVRADAAASTGAVAIA